jgi:hypothetical protein
MTRSVSCDSHGRLAKGLVLLALLAVLPGLGYAQQRTAEWLADSSTGCRVWNPFPQFDESITWKGPCVDGFAHGRGPLRWFISGKLFGTDEGEFRRGKLHGFARLAFTNGMRFEGNFEDHEPNGQGTLRTENGEVYSGHWSYGCFRDGNRTKAFGVTPDTCEFH